MIIERKEFIKNREQYLKPGSFVLRGKYSLYNVLISMNDNCTYNLTVSGELPRRKIHG